MDLYYRYKYSTNTEEFPHQFTLPRRYSQYLDPIRKAFGWNLSAEDEEIITQYPFDNENAISITITAPKAKKPIGYLFMSLVKDYHGCDADTGFCFPINGNFHKTFIIDKTKYQAILAETINDKKEFNFYTPTTYDSHISICTYFKEYEYGLNEKDIERLFKIGPIKFGKLHHDYEYPKFNGDYEVKIEMV